MCSFTLQLSFLSILLRHSIFPPISSTTFWVGSSSPLGIEYGVALHSFPAHCGADGCSVWALILNTWIEHRDDENIIIHFRLNWCSRWTFFDCLFFYLFSLDLTLLSSNSGLAFYHTISFLEVLIPGFYASLLSINWSFRQLWRKSFNCFRTSINRSIALHVTSDVYDMYRRAFYTRTNVFDRREIPWYIDSFDSVYRYKLTGPQIRW